MASHQTVPGLTQEAADQVIRSLQQRMTGLVDLALTLKHVHWNVTGPNFIAVHEMLDPQVDEVREMVDVLAERIATLGGTPIGTPGAIVENRTWDDYDVGTAPVETHLVALDAVYSGVIDDHRASMTAIESVDLVTSDILTGQTAQLEQFQWFVRAHLSQTGRLPARS